MGVDLAGYALPGGSRFLIVGATSAAAVLSASAVNGVSSDPGAVVGLFGGAGGRRGRGAGGSRSGPAGVP
ncbi:hypothetical protein AB0M00_11600 [Streptomyces chartreusis]|uniref:hypothetical protein n=1 Tax=Streptomyces chartreusis TaxID=1969 RepID=UPI00279D715F|nr:hypothetical protein POD33_04360 [Streptomyces moderatus]